MKYNVIVVGAGLAGLVATAELASSNKKVLLLDQEPESSLGGQAWWSFGGVFLVDTPEQRRMGIKDSHELAWSDWLGSAQFDREIDQDYWAKKWAEAYVNFASTEKRPWLVSKGIKFFPVVGWAERGGYLSEGHGNSVPRFHITWGTGPGLVKPFEEKVREAIKNGNVHYRSRHRVDDLIVENQVVKGVKGTVLSPSNVLRGEKSSREKSGEFEYYSDATIVASGGIGANHELIRKNWPQRLGPPPQKMLSGVPDHVDGRMLTISEKAGGKIVNKDRMWHYAEGITNWNSIWPKHGIRILPGPSSIWLDAKGKRFPVPYLPGFDTLGTTKAILDTGYDYSWFILTKKIIEKEFALSGSEQNPDLTDKSIKKLLSRILPGPPAPVQAFMDKGEDFIVTNSLQDLVKQMNQLAGNNLLSLKEIEQQIIARDLQLDNKYSKDLQITAIRGARKYFGDKLIRVAPLHKLLDPKNGPLIAVRLHILSRKTLGGLQTDLTGNVIDSSNEPFKGLYAIGEAAGFGGGGLHGYRALEGTFLGGCLFTGKEVGRFLSKQ
ncbi:FAD-binding dehydrogenase [Bacillus carboniphilus]|uniref:FAD-binding dehydrogenase n=1 Tax=Bacillus carboniphilus TaxID=86663 RepID=A0ABY9JXF6_9BACI|nr:FAD-binding dehydrogenase [Bacillus carboniphilus]WLR43008.1 FAD-binding dehydrogenase [Bacillus carboniphilus]